MKKGLIVGASIIALALSVCLFVFSVFAVGNDFSVNNKIVFEGTSEYLVFDINAEITGTTNDGSDALKTSWGYNHAENQDMAFLWEVPEVLTFNSNGIAPQDICITYTFAVTNKSVGNGAIRVYIEDPINFDDDALTYEIVGSVNNQKTILAQATDVVSLKLRPKNGEFKGEKSINFNLKIEEAY